MSEEYALYVAAGDVGASHVVDSPEFTDFAVGQALYLSFILSATRVTGSANATLNISISWYNAAAISLTPFSQSVAIVGTFEGLQKMKPVPPVGAVKGVMTITITPAASPMQHNVAVKKLRLGKTELAATNGADWLTNVANLPPNLAELVGDESIKNKAILDSIANDDVLSRQEKISKLIPLNTELEARYTQIRARAVELGLSTATLDSQRNNWLTLLNFYSPAWNDTSVDTSIFVNAMPGASRAFPTGWGMTSVSAVAAGVYTTLTDADAGVFSNAALSNRFPFTAGQNASVGIVMQKSVTHTLNWAMFRLYSYTGSGALLGYIDLAVNPYNGSSTTSVSGIPAGSGFGMEVYDLGTEWLVRVTMNNAPATSAVGSLEIYPAISAQGDAWVTGYDPAATGSINIRAPIAAVGAGGAGDYRGLGRYGLMGRLSKYTSELEALAKAISVRDGSTSVVIDPFPDVVIYADSTGAVKTSLLPKDVGITASIGTSNVSTLGAWSRTAVNGVTCTIGANTGILNITGFSGAEVFVPISFTYAGVTRTGKVRIFRQDDPQTNTTGGAGGGSSTGGTTASTTTLGATTGTTYSATALSPVLQAKAGSNGKVDLSAIVDFRRTSTGSGTTTVAGKWQWRVVGGTFADVTAEVANEYGATTSGGGVSGEPLTQDPGRLNVPTSKTGLTNGTTYEFQFSWRRTGGINSEAAANTANMTAAGS